MLLRTIGVAALGLIGGVLFAIIAQDIVARALLADHAGSKARALLGLILPACCLAGAVLAVRIDCRGR